MTWNELKKQIIQAHDEKIDKYKKLIFPEYNVTRNSISSYEEYISNIMEQYKENIKNGINHICELELPDDVRFQNIVQRAFDKVAPFEGKDKKSDKGFKDVLIWESILQLAEINNESDIIFFSQDKGFKQALVEEFESKNPESSLTICVKFDEVSAKLERWAKEIDQYVYISSKSSNYLFDLEQWINSANSIVQLIDREWIKGIHNDSIDSRSLHIISYDNLEKLQDANRYSFDANLKICYSLKDNSFTEKNMRIYVEVEKIDEGDYEITKIEPVVEES